MDYKVIITPRKLCDAGMEALAAQANYEVVDKVNACNFLPELQKADALMIKEGGIGPATVPGHPLHQTCRSSS